MYFVELRDITDDITIYIYTSTDSKDLVVKSTRYVTSVHFSDDYFQLFDFIDELADLSCLVYQKNSQTYLPYNKDWVKEKIYILLRNQAGKN